MNEIYSKNDKKVNFTLLTLVNTRFNTAYSMRSYFIHLISQNSNKYHQAVLAQYRYI